MPDMLFSPVRLLTTLWLLSVVWFCDQAVAIELADLQPDDKFSQAIVEVEEVPDESLQSLHEALAKADSDERRSRLSYLLARAYAALSEPDLAMQHYQQVQQLAQALGDDELEHRADYGVASINLYHGNPVVALNIFKRLRISDEKSGDLTRLGSTLNNIAVSYRLLGKPDLAMQYFIEALVYKEQYENPISVARTLTNIGEMELDLDQLVDARERLTRAESIFEGQDRGKDLMRVFSLLGNIDVKEGQYPAAMQRYQQVLDYYLAHGPKTALAQTYRHIADLYAMQQQMDKSIAMLEQALELSDRLSDGVLSPDIAVRLGQAYLNKQQPEVALTIYQQAMSREQAQGEGVYQGSILLGMSQASEALGDYKLALGYLKQYQEHLLGLKSSEMRKQAQELHQKFDVAEKDASIRVLEQENALHATELAKQAYQRQYWLSGSLLLILGSAFITYRQRSRRLHLAEKASVTETILEKKRALFANISHEFRTPLTLILGPLHQLAKQPITPEKQQQLLSQIELNAQRMLRMVDQVLQLARLEADNEQGMQRVMLDHLVLQTAIELQPLFEQKQIVLTNQIEPDCMVLGDAELLEKVVVNLLSNAAKYTPEQGTVCLALTGSDRQISLRVADSGIGMTDEAMSQVFERFVRAHVGVDSAKGVGIGLALVKEIVEAHKGEIRVSSRVNEGTEFTLVLPRYRGSAQAQVTPHQVRPDIYTTAPLAAQLSASASCMEDEADIDADDPRPTVLIIDDHPEIVAMVADILAADYCCLTETDSQRAVTMAIEQVPDLIITDLMMPQLDGFGVSREIRNHPATSHIPLMLLTAKGDDSSRLQAWQSDIDAYLSKPFNPDELLLRCAGLINVRRKVARHLQQMGMADNLVAVPEAVGQDNGAETVQLNSRDQQFIDRLAAAMAKFYGNSELDKAMLARAVAMSERQLQRKMQALFAQTPTDYVRSFRLQKSLTALKNGESVTQVAESVGFSSAAYFSQCFKLQFGISPSEYVRQHTA